MHQLAALCVRRPVFATVLVLSLVVVGVFAYFRLGVDRFPEIDFPVVTIQTRLVGAAPEEIETEITERIEEAVNTISGIDILQSVSAEGASIVTVQFDLEKDGDVGAQEVRDRVNAIVGDLPRDADPPIVDKFDIGAIPVVSIVLSGTADIRALTEFADKVLRRRIESVLGVGQVTVLGGRARQINIVVDTARLAALDLTVAEVVGALASQNVQVPGGRVEQGSRELTLRTYGRVARPEEFALIPVAQRGGITIRVGDLARVEDGMEEETSWAALDGERAVTLEVRKQSGSNTIEVVERVRGRLAEIGPEIPPGFRLDLVRDQSTYIVAAVNAVEEHLVLGSLFASAIVWIFLRKLRPTIIAAVAIPSALIATFAAMEAMDFTLNILTLLALTLAVGIVIDDAMIVLEIVFRHMEEKGHGPAEAAVSGTREIGLAVVATSLSLIAVFLPVAFMSGIVGRFMHSFGVTMAFAIAVSLLVAFTLTPVMCSRWLREQDVAAEVRSRERGLYAWIERGYLSLLGLAMRHRALVVAMLLLVFASSVPLAMIANKNFLPDEDESMFDVVLRAPEGTSLSATRTILESIAGRIRAMDGVQATLATAADDLQRTQNFGRVFVQLAPVGDRDRSQAEIMEAVRREVLPLYGRLRLRAQVSEVSAMRSSFSMAEIQFWIGGPELGKLEEYSRALLEKLRAMPGVVDADTNLFPGKPELGVRIDRQKAADLGVRVQDLATTLNVLVGGLKVTDFYEGGEQYEVHVRAAAGDRRDAEGIARAEVPSSTAGTVTVRDVTRLEEGTGPSEVNRIARRRLVLLTCNMKPGHSSQAVMNGLVESARGLDMPPSYSWGFTGRSREQGKMFLNFGIAFLLSIIFMYLILAAQFESWLHPATILLALPMTVPFALLSIVLLNQSLNIFSLLGILVLFGIVKKNGILQIDNMNVLVAKGLPRDEAVRQANRDRLRPILMTTLAFVAGMIPLVASSSTGAATNRAIGSVIIGGQTLVLVLTLVGTPVAWSLFEDWRRSEALRRAADAVLLRRVARWLEERRARRASP